MSGLTRSGVAYDITISPHNHIINYGNITLEYIFSSDRYKQIFLKKLEDNREKINSSLINRFSINLEVNLLADLKLYSMTEKRGFLIKTEKEEYRCLSTIKLDGLMMTKEN